MRIIDARDILLEDELRRIRDRGKFDDQSVGDAVRTIIHDVATRGNEALFEYTKKFDGVSLSDETVEVAEDEMNDALAALSPADRRVLETAAERIGAFHRKQLTDSWSYTDEDGVELGQVIRPLKKVGIYTPGGRAPYPSTVLMAAVPAQVAGVDEIILVTPPPDGTINQLILAAARIAGVTRVFKVGGAQAIAALAFGTASIPRVDKIVGPGNIYVATAKMMVYGHVGIDMVAGPSEIVVIADGSAKPEIVAADLLSQAEHDEMASAMLLTPDGRLAREVANGVFEQLQSMTRKAIAEKAVKDHGIIIVTKDLGEAVDIANRIAPEHLELMVKNPDELLGKVESAGAVFLGCSTPEAVGDYIAGPNHILPTGGTARFSSPLGIYDFIKRTSIISFSQESLTRYGHDVERFAQLEGFEAHGRSVAIRLGLKKS